MCLYCHLHGSDESAVSMLKDCLKNPHFDKWDTTSFNHLILSLNGLNGEEAHQIAEELIENFYQWFLGSTRGVWQFFYSYNPCIEAFPHSSQLRKQINDAKEFYQENKDKTKEEMVYLLTGKTIDEIKNHR